MLHSVTDFKKFLLDQQVYNYLATQVFINQFATTDLDEIPDTDTDIEAMSTANKYGTVFIVHIPDNKEEYWQIYCLGSLMMKKKKKFLFDQTPSIDE